MTDDVMTDDDRAFLRETDAKLPEMTYEERRVRFRRTSELFWFADSYDELEAIIELIRRLRTTH